MKPEFSELLEKIEKIGKTSGDPPWNFVKFSTIRCIHCSVHEIIPKEKLKHALGMPHTWKKIDDEDRLISALFPMQTKWYIYKAAHGGWQAYLCKNCKDTLLSD